MKLLSGAVGGRRELRLRVGPYRVVVTEVPGRSLWGREWRTILLARGSYPAMWGDPHPEVFAEDPLDGRCGGPYRTTHYIAWVREGTGRCKLLTMRKVALDPSRLTPAQLADPGDLLPLDLRLWRARAACGAPVPLWELLRTHARRMAPYDGWAEFRIASMGRTATFPYGEHHRTPKQRERTAIAFAAIQLLATCDDPNLFHVWSLCREFQDRVLGVVSMDGRYVAPDFVRTEKALGLHPGSVRMDNALPVVQEHKLAFPGYFIDNDDATRLLAFLLDGGQIVVADLADAIHRVTAEEPALAPVLATADHRTLAEILTRPRRFKHLAPRIASDQPLSRMSADEFRACLLHGTGDGPFSATVVPQAWAASARAVLAAADEKYAAARYAPPRHPDAAWERRYSSTMTSVSSSSEVSDARLSKEIVPWRSKLMRSATSRT